MSRAAGPGPPRGGLSRALLGRDRRLTARYLLVALAVVTVVPVFVGAVRFFGGGIGEGTAQVLVLSLVGVLLVATFGLGVRVARTNGGLLVVLFLGQSWLLGTHVTLLVFSGTGLGVGAALLGFALGGAAFAIGAMARRLG